MSRTSQILAFSVPPAVAKQVQSLAKKEQRTKSELFREMVRVYERDRTRRGLEDEHRWASELFARALAEESVSPMTEEQMQALDKELARYGEQQTKKLGIKPKDLDRYIIRKIHERRKARLA
jgi:hypothetical protein